MKLVTSSIIIGITAGIIFSLSWYLMAASMGFHTVNVYVYRNYLSFVLIILGVILSVYFTKKSNNGFLEFKDALKAGMLFSLILATFMAIFNYVYYAILTPETIDYFLNEAKIAMVTDKNLKPEDYPKYLESVKANYGSFRLVPPVLFWGLIVSLITGAIMQKKNPYEFIPN